MGITSKEVILIQSLKKILSSPKMTKNLILGIGDDAAILQIPAQKPLLVTTDCLIENVHFTLETTTAQQLGWKSIAVNLSDIAAMGGVPCFGFISLALPPHIQEPWIKEFYRGIRRCSDQFHLVIAGGDTSRSPHELMINVVVLGITHQKKAALRSLAKPGDIVFATGTFGGSAAGLALLQKYGKKTPKTYKELLRYHLEPQPRIDEGSFLLHNTKRLALMDASDGLANALQLISFASQCGMEIHTETIPISPHTRKACTKLLIDPLEIAMNGGEDYELVGTCSPTEWAWIQKRWHFSTSLTAIGRVTEKPGIYLLSPGRRRRPLRSFGYDHFKK